ncbi:UDP-N-acetylmuramoyl-tripeptide--D-alanyl-D-alanine ligase [Metabacillus malikii]|uniref:UDP-N-acetylmuramoyl-tripeptide--D-alanyl-D-alanine ligase n=1 Tax=Metabacillus malikii TaxID=1504265 RepID=A0ABT9ZL28_9BACI|nr:UDP-N-acetylmuramoyl-tripeptide--D-alanyl-D-alanine ligase [Metabacillus malikii]MDQ0232491.1 UDP-N-acetylmuramoyl-tripeptide--D-alanyl-D-alanine ligase [Metabacillus malikii]
MISRTLREIEKMVNGSGLEVKDKDKDNHIIGVSTDTRTTANGNLFIPLVGENFDGHKFVSTAIDKGAKAIIWSRKVPNPPLDIPVIYVDDTLTALQDLAENYLEQVNPKVVGITGSNGKTTTKDMVAAVLETTYKIHKTNGNYNNHIGLPLTILSMDEETEIVILEMGMSGKGEIELLSNIAKPDVAVITNIGEAHLLDLGSREAIAEAKLEIVNGLKSEGILIYHGDEPLLQERVPTKTQKTITFGNSTENDYFATSITQKVKGTTFQIAEETYSLPVLGKHNIQNALAAYAVARHYHVKTADIKKGFQQLKVTGMRLELQQTSSGISIINDAYNASPSSMRAAINLLEDLDGFNKKIVVLGDMLELGKDEKNYHFEIGKAIDPGKITYVLTYGQLGAEIAEGAKQVISEEFVRHFEDKEALVNTLKSLTHTGDVVLVKASRGMKLEDVVNSMM